MFLKSLKEFFPVIWSTSTLGFLLALESSTGSAQLLPYLTVKAKGQNFLAKIWNLKCAP